MEEIHEDPPVQDEIENAPAVSMEGWNHYFDDAGVYTFSTPAYTATSAAPNATRVVLPNVPEGHWPVFDGDAWRLMEDHRGKKGWVDGENTTITALGPLPDNWSDMSPKTIQSEEAILA